MSSISLLINPNFVPTHLFIQVIVIMIMENSDGNVCKKQNKTKCQTQKNFEFLFQSFVPPLKNNISIGIKQ